MFGLLTAVLFVASFASTISLSLTDLSGARRLTT
jgi:hypothetical protein